MEDLRQRAANGDFKAKSELRRMEMAGNEAQDTKDEMAAIQVCLNNDYAYFMLLLNGWSSSSYLSFFSFSFLNK